MRVLHVPIGDPEGEEEARLKLRMPEMPPATASRGACLLRSAAGNRLSADAQALR